MSASKESDATETSPLQLIERCLARQQWETAAKLAWAVGNDAVAGKKVNIANAAAGALEKLGDRVRAAHLLAWVGRVNRPSDLPEWDGSSLDGRTILIVHRIRHVGAVIRQARLIAMAAQQAKHCIVLAEDRLVSLFQRSFPRAEIRPGSAENEKSVPDADVIASYETLTEYLIPTSSAGLTGFVPLVPDSNEIQSFRSAYGGESRFLIGFCWQSTNKAKDLPPLDKWAEFMTCLDTRFVSIQYGDVRSSIAKLHELNRPSIIVDDTVDSLKDFDRFAAQVASLDAIVTISNTGAHMSGALGKPTFVLLDDKHHLVWPFRGNTTDWYPSVFLQRKNCRDWAEVFDDIRHEVTQRWPKIVN